MIEASQPLLRLLQGLRRDVDEVHARRRSPTLQRFGKERELLPASTAKLDDGWTGPPRSVRRQGRQAVARSA